MPPELVLRMAKKRKLDGIAVVDHDLFKGTLEVKKLNKDKDFKVILSEEVTTNKGHLLAYDIHSGIKSRDFFEAADEIHRQGGLAVIAHPFRPVKRHHFQLPLKSVKGILDAVEGFNGRILLNQGNIRAQEEAKKLGFPMTAGSDAHIRFEVGRCWMEFKGDWRKAILSKKAALHGSIWQGRIGGVCTGLHRLRLI